MKIYLILMAILFIFAILNSKIEYKSKEKINNTDLMVVLIQLVFLILNIILLVINWNTISWRS